MAQARYVNRTFPCVMFGGRRHPDTITRDRLSHNGKVLRSEHAGRDADLQCRVGRRVARHAITLIHPPQRLEWPHYKLDVDQKECEAGKIAGFGPQRRSGGCDCGKMTGAKVRSFSRSPRLVFGPRSVLCAPWRTVSKAATGMHLRRARSTHDIEIIKEPNPSILIPLH